MFGLSSRISAVSSAMTLLNRSFLDFQAALDRAAKTTGAESDGAFGGNSAGYTKYQARPSQLLASLGSPLIGAATFGQRVRHDVFSELCIVLSFFSCFKLSFWSFSPILVCACSNGCSGRGGYIQVKIVPSCLNITNVEVHHPCIADGRAHLSLSDYIRLLIRFSDEASLLYVT